MNCLVVRDLLPELAIGVLGPGDRTEVERHLRWCAGCRKESSDLGRAAATLAFALSPAPVPESLGDRVVERVRRAAGEPGRPRRVRTTAAAIVAATIAVASLGWGAAMAGRADRFEARAEQAHADQLAAIKKFRTAIERIIPGQDLPADESRLGQLAPQAAGAGGGFVLQFVSPQTIDFTMVIVNGLSPADAGRLPYRVRLYDAAGNMLPAGRIVQLDANGGAEVFRQYNRTDLTGYTSVRVVDADGDVVLAGGIDRT